MNSSDFSSASSILVGVLNRAIARAQPNAPADALTQSIAERWPKAGRVPRVIVTWQQAQAIAGPEVGLIAARELHLGDIDPKGRLLNVRGTLRDAVEVATRYHRMICQSMAITAKSDERNLVLGFELLEDQEVPNSLLEFSVASLCRLVRFVFGEFPIEEVRFHHMSQCTRAALDATFGCTVTLGAPDTAIVIRGNTSALRGPVVGRTVGSSLTEHPSLEHDQPPQPQTLSGLVYERLVTALPLRDTGAVDVARELQMSERTLRRRLSEESTSHRHLLEQARREVAIRLLGEQRLSIDEVAYHLGYAQSSSFQRAFKRWTGMPPATFRLRCGRAST